MKFAPIIDPNARKPSPKPVRVDLRKVFLFGTIVWAIALAVCMILTACGNASTTREGIHIVPINKLRD